MQTEKNTEKKNFSTPGRVNIEDVKKQADELRDAKNTLNTRQAGAVKVLNAVSLYGTAIDFALIIAIPLVSFILLGKYLDTRQGTKFYVLIGILLALIVSSFGIYKQIKKLQEYFKKKK